MVRLPCGSMSTHSTRWPSSANAAARFSAVVVLATPPFWLANAMTLALPDTVGSHGRGRDVRRPIRRALWESFRVEARGTPRGAGSARPNEPPPTHLASHPMTLGEILDGKRVCICGGSGGVGKTTTSAAIAAGMAARGLRVAVVTIDPARRLATALGLPELGNEPRRIDGELFATAGLPV